MNLGGSDRGQTLRHLLSRCAFFVGPVVLAAGVQAWTHAAQDLSDLPGAASGHILLDAVRQRLFGAPAEAGLQGFLVDLAVGLPLPLVDSLHLVMAGCFVAAVLGAVLAGAALGGRWGALGAGVVAATWGLAVELGWFISYDTMALGAGWLGAGLCLLGARLAGPWVLLVPAGVAALDLAVMTKEVAHPLLALLVVLPLLALRGGGRWRLPSTAAVLLFAVGGVQWLQARLEDATRERSGGLALPDDPAVTTRVSSGEPVLDVDAVLAGLQATWDMLVGPGGIWVQYLVVLGGGAVVGALLPGRRWGARLATVAVGIAAFGVIAATIPSWLRLRYLVVPAMPLVVMAGVALGILGQLLARILPRRARVLGLLPILGGGGLGLHDTMDVAWSLWETRAEANDVPPPDLPRPPAMAWNINDGRVKTDFRELTLRHLDEARALLGEEAPGTVVMPVLRDARSMLVLAAAGIDHGHRGYELQSARCCRDVDARSCAREVLGELDDAGLLLLLPVGPDVDPRSHMAEVELQQHLTFLAKRREGVRQTDHWLLFRGTGDSGVLPCGMLPD